MKNLQTSKQNGHILSGIFPAATLLISVKISFLNWKKHTAFGAIAFYVTQLYKSSHIVGKVLY